MRQAVCRSRLGLTAVATISVLALGGCSDSPREGTGPVHFLWRIVVFVSLALAALTLAVMVALAAFLVIVAQVRRMRDNRRPH
jgi:hypothetical protein